MKFRMILNNKPVLQATNGIRAICVRDVRVWCACMCVCIRSLRLEET